MRAIRSKASAATGVVRGPRGGRYVRTQSGKLRSVSEAEVRALEASIRSVLHPGLLKPEFRKSCEGKPASYGHCYAASEAAYHALGGKEAGWTPQNVKHENAPHWFLKHASGRILDPTADQFKTPVPYERAVGKGFLTKEPSKRARAILGLVKR